MKTLGSIMNLQQQEAARIALESIQEGKIKSKKQILQEAGYSESIQRSPSQIFSSDGFKKAIQELTAALNIDKESRLLRLAQIFWTGTPRDAMEANKEISKMQGDYAPVQKEIKDLREVRNTIITKPE